MKHAKLPSLLATAMLFCAAAAAQDYPARPIRMVVPFPPGGGVDIAARVTAQKFIESWGQQVIVDNRGGAGGVIAMDIAAKAAPDGYTLIMGAAGPVAITVSLYAKVPFDPVRDFAPVALAASTLYALAVHPGVPAKSVKELIAYSKANPKRLTFASTGIGSPPHLSGELLKSMTGADMTHVPYKGTGPALTDLMGGQVSLMFSDVIAAYPHIKAGKLRALAISSASRAKIAPELPTVAEAGVPGYAAVGWTGLLAPAGTPRGIINKLNAEIVRILPLPDVTERLAGDGSEFDKNTPEQFAAFIKSEIAKWSNVIKASGAKAE